MRLFWTVKKVKITEFGKGVLEYLENNYNSILENPYLYRPF
ncbi:MAG: hypothetical protein ACYCT7_05960 [bacterium]